MPLNWQSFSVPLSSGMNTLPDKRALPPTELAVCRDVQFVPGGMGTRLPYASIGTGSNSFEDPRKLVSYGDELLMFTKENLFSYSPTAGAWINKGTHLAATIAEKHVFLRDAAQIQCERGELGGVVFYAWAEPVGAAFTVYVAAADKQTGAVMLSPLAINSGTSLRPRLCVLTNKVLLFFSDTAAPSLRVIALDPLDPAGSSGVASTVVVTGSTAYHATLCYDVEAVFDVVTPLTCAFLAYARNDLASYGLSRVTEALAITSTTKARTANSPLAVAVHANQANIEVVRASGTAVKGDYLTIATFADVHVDQALGTATAAPKQIAACWRDPGTGDAGHSKCFVWWESNEDDSYNGECDLQAITVDDNNTVGGLLLTWDTNIGIASRPFQRNGRIYLWLAFAGESLIGRGGVASYPQSSYFLYRDDGFLCGKAVAATAAGFVFGRGWLPNVQSVGSEKYAWCAGANRVVLFTNGSRNDRPWGRAEPGPREVVVTFDDNGARQCRRLGETLYISGGEPLQYDGTGLTEVGFHVYPWHLPCDVKSSGAGKDTGKFWWKQTYAWRNGRGELDRSTTITLATLHLASGGVAEFTPIPPLFVTHKKAPRSDCTVEMWGTLADAPDGAPYFLQTSTDRTDVAGDDDYLANTPGTAALAPADLYFSDSLADADAAKRQANPETGDVLENLPPTACTVIACNQDRLFLAGAPGYPNRVYYSKLREDGKVAAFHDALVADVPLDGGPIVALSFLAETLIAFCDHAIYALPGVGYDNLGGGNNYGPARIVSPDVGAVTADSVALAPSGILFKSQKGWYLLGHGEQVQYVGGPVAAFDGDTVNSVTVVESRHQIRCLTDSRCLVYDYRVQQWSEWTITGPSAVMYRGRYVYIAEAGDALGEQSDYSTGVNYGIDIESAWINFGQLQAYGAVREMAFLGESRSAFRLRLRIAYDYADSDADGPTWVDDKVIDTTPTVVGAPFQLIHGPRRHKAQAFKVRLTACSTLSLAPPTGEALKLTGMTFEIGLKRGIHKRLPATQKS